MKDIFGLLKLEIRILNRLRHPSIIKLLDSFEDRDGTYYLVYEMCRDGDLASKIQRKGRLSEEKSLKILKEIASAFVYLKDQEIIHRDMKPENIFLDGPDIKIGDFGLCNQGQIFHDKAFVGSIAFQAPEIHTKKVYSSLTDVYAIGVCFYEMLMGKLPFTSQDVDDIINVKFNLRVTNDVGADISERSMLLLRKMLEPHEDRRITIAQVLYEVEDLLLLTTGRRTSIRRYNTPSYQQKGLIHESHSPSKFLKRKKKHLKVKITHREEKHDDDAMSWLSTQPGG